MLDSWLRTLQTLPPFLPTPAHLSLPPEDVMFEACDLLSYIVWYTCTHVFNVKRYCIVSKCFANTLAERNERKIQ